MTEEYVLIPYCVEHSCDGWRLDQYLSHKIRRLSRTQVQALIKKSLVSEKPLKASSRVKTGLEFHLRRAVQNEPETPTEVPELLSDDSILILDKPAGLPIHPTASYYKGTLVTILRARYPGGFPPSPAHRLDRETSGLLVCGKSSLVCRKLMEIFVSHQVKKEYLAIVEGHPKHDAFDIDLPIAEGTEKIRIAVRIDFEVGKPSQTHFEVVKRFERDGAPFSLVRCFPKTGRQHQIRVHLREAGFPIVGDKMYGPSEEYFDRFAKRCLEPEAWLRLRMGRQALHAAALNLPHPMTREPIRVESPLPADMQAFLDGAPVPFPTEAGLDDLTEAA